MLRDNSDPIDAAKELLTALGVGEDEFKAMDKEIRAIVAASADYAESSPEPEPGELYTDVLVEQY